MELDQFISQVKAAKTKIKVGSEQLFLETLQRHGAKSQQVVDLIRTLVPIALQPKMRTFLETVIVKKEQPINIKSLVRPLIQQYTQIRFIKPIDLFEMIRSQCKENISDIERCALEYGLIQQQPVLFKENLLKKLQEIATILNGAQGNQGWIDLEKIIHSEQALYTSACSTFMQSGLTILSAEQLKQVASVSMIKIKEEKLIELFKAANNLGHLHEIVQKIISECTYPKFEKEVCHLVSFIQTKSSNMDFKVEIPQLHRYLLDELFIEQDDICRLIEAFYFQKDGVVMQILKTYNQNKEKIRQKIKLILKQLISHLDEDYQYLQINKIVDFSKYLMSLQKEEANSNKLNKQKLKVDLIELKMLLIEDKFMEEDKLVDMVKEYYAGRRQNFEDILNDYGIIEEDPDCMNRIMNHLDEWVSNQSGKDRENNIALILSVMSTDKLKGDDRDEEKPKSSHSEQPQRQKSRKSSSGSEGRLKSQLLGMGCIEESSELNNIDIMQLNLIANMLETQSNRDEQIINTEKISSEFEIIYDDGINVQIESEKSSKSSKSEVDNHEDRRIQPQQSKKVEEKLKEYESDKSIKEQEKKVNKFLSIGSYQSISSQEDINGPSIYDHLTNEPNTVKHVSQDENFCDSKPDEEKPILPIFKQQESSKSLLSDNIVKQKLHVTLKAKRQQTKMEDQQIQIQTASFYDINSDNLQHNPVNFQQRKNPFLQQFANIDDRIIKNIVIFISKKSRQLQICRSWENYNGYQSLVIKETKQYEFKGATITLLAFQFGKTGSKTLYIQKTHKKKSERYFLKLNQINGTCLNLIIEEQIKAEARRAIVNFSLLQSITFLTNNIPSNGAYKNQQSFLWLYWLYYFYREGLSREDESQIFNSISLVDDKREIKTKNMISFLFTVLNESSYDLLRSSKLFQKFLFTKTYDLANMKYYKIYPQMLLFYLKMNLLHCIDFCTFREDTYQIWNYQRYILDNIQLQPKEQIYQLLFQVAKKHPNVLRNIDAQLVKEMKNNRHFTANHYFKLRVLYFGSVVEKKQPMEVSQMIINFLQDMMAILINIGPFKPSASEVITYPEYQSLIFTKSCFNLSLRILDRDLTDFYRLSKLLHTFSEGQIKVLDISLHCMANKGILIDASNTVQMTLAMILPPINQLDRDQLQKFYSRQKIHISHFKNMLASLLKQVNEYPKQSLEQFFSILIELVLTKNNSMKALEIDELLQILDSASQQPRNNHQQAFIFKLFAALLSKINFIRQDRVKNSLYIEPRLFKKSLDTCYKLKNDLFSKMMLNKIFTEFNTKFSQRAGSEVVSKISYAYQLEYSQQNNDKKEYFISRYLEGIQVNEEKLEKNLWELLLSNPAQLKLFKARFKQTYQKVYSKIIQIIQQDKLYAKELREIHQKNQKIAAHSSEFKQVVKEAVKKLRKFENKIKICISILKKQQDFFFQEIHKFQDYQVRILKLRLQQVYQIQKDHQPLLNNCEQIIHISQYPFWNFLNITNLATLNEEYVSLKTQIQKHISDFKEKTITYENFAKYFLTSNFISLLHILSPDTAFERQLKIFIKKISQKYIKKINNMAKSVKYISLISKSETNIDNQFIEEFSCMIREEHLQFSAYRLYEQILIVQKNIAFLFNYQSSQEKKNSLNAEFQEIESAKVIQQTFRAKSLFQMIKKKQIDRRMINDLREYINDLQNSVLRFETIKQFEEVVDYWEMVSTTPNLFEMISKIQKKAENRNLSLTDCIKNCSANFRNIEQKIEQAVNRETSFKYQIDAIFTDSLFVVNEQQSIRIEIKKSVMGDRSSKKIINQESEQNTIIIDFKQLSSFRDKSILLIRDYSRQQTKDQTIDELIKSFKLYEQFFNIVEAINTQSKRLANYGYSPALIIKSIVIKDKNFEDLINLKDQLIRIGQSWVSGIKEMYARSYLLTHFLGSELDKFVQYFLEGKYHPSLQRILCVSQEQYQQQMALPRLVEILRDAEAQSVPLRRVGLLIEAFAGLERKFLKSQILGQESIAFDIGDNSFEYEGDQKPIVLLTCSPKQIYCCLFEKKRETKPTQVLFCQQITSVEQIQLFFFRAMLRPTHRHYIVGSHLLQDDVKISCCDMLADLLRERGSDLRRAQLVFVDNVINDKLYAFLARPNQFLIRKKELFLTESQNRTKNMLDKLSHTEVLTSSRPGLGKTFRAHQKAKHLGKTLRHFPVCGNIDFQSLSKRLKALQLKQNEALLIQVGHIQNCREMESFMTQMVLFRCFYYEQYVFLPADTPIFIEMENILNTFKENPYHILNILKQSKMIQHIEKFDLSLFEIDPDNMQDKFVMIYLNYLSQQGWLRENQYKFTQDYLPSSQQLEFPKNWFNLLNEYFIKSFQKKDQQPSFYQLRSFFNMLFQIFKTFSNSPYFMIQGFKEVPVEFKALQLDKLRESFLQNCIKNSLEFIDQTINSNEFIERREGQKSMTDKLRSFPMLIVPTVSQENYEFIYLNDKEVQLSIKSFYLSQNPKYLQRVGNIRNVNQIHQIFSQTALNRLNSTEQQAKMYQILLALSQNKKFSGNMQQVEANIPKLKQYKITLDNFFKMCLIIHRSRCLLPIIIMGESGVGKTALIDFLVREIFEQKLIIYNVHAGIHEKEITKWVKQIKKAAENNKQRIWVFFDEFNTTDELSYLKEIIVDRSFQGQLFSKNIVFLAACNPYRRRQEGQRVKAGIKKTQFFHQNRQNQLAFRVKPPGLSMVHLMWDYQQLGKQQNAIYIKKMLNDVKYHKLEMLVQAIVASHEYLKQTVEVSAVSLRDVARFRQLCHWFMKYMPKDEDKINHKASNLKINRWERAVILSFVFCYALRFSTNRERNIFLQRCESTMGYNRGYMQKILQEEQQQYIMQLNNSEEKIALNNALMENVFVELVCLMNKIPVLLIGNPGSSKSLSIKMLNSNLRGENSHSSFCRQFPEINMIYFQGSQSSTSHGVEQVFEKAKTSRVDNKKYRVQNCILFDEIGLAQKSIHNPLKVLHSRLQTNCKEIAFIGISNWELDAAKMSRFLVLARSEPDVSDLRDTAAKICQSYFGKNYNHVQKIKQLGTYYHKFVQSWKQNKNNRQAFFGLRDFYNYVKAVCVFCESNPTCELSALDIAIANSIQTNFDGQEGSLKMFCQLARLPYHHEKLINPVELVCKNLSETDSRCLMLIVRGDAMIPLINSKVGTLQGGHKIVSIYGSTFKEDQQSQQYNLEITSLVISHISRGNVLAFKDINNSIQTSFYDLFNKSYSRSGSKKYCRIAVGANSNPKCIVHQKFNAIVYVDEKKLRDLDLPFLNRFEKHYLTLRSMATSQQIRLLQELQEWLDGLLEFRDDMLLKRQNFIYNCSEESLVTLLIQLRGKIDIIPLAKAKLLQNSTTDFDIALKGRPELLVKFEVEKYRKMRKNVKYCKEDMIIFTYDQFSALRQEQSVLGKKNYSIRLSQIGNERTLRRQLQTGYGQGDWNCVQIKLNYQRDYMHINWLLFLAKQIKQSLDSQKQTIVIIQLHRFSLHQLFIDYINISYLHQYQQFFIEDLHSLQEMSVLLQSQNCWDLYTKLQLSNQLTTYYIDALKLIKFDCQNQQNGQIHINQYFSQCLQISNNEYFLQIANKFFMQILLKREPNFDSILHNAEDIMCCSNVHEALSSNIRSMVRQLLFYLLRHIVQQGLLFHFNSKSALEVQPNQCSKYFGRDFVRSSAQIDTYHKETIDQQSKKLIQRLPKLKIQCKFQPVVESNTVKIGQIPLLPGSTRDFSKILERPESSFESLQKIVSRIPQKRLEQNEDEYNLALDSARKFIQSFIIRGATVFERQSKILFNLYLYDVFMFLLKEWEIPSKNVCEYVKYWQHVLQQKDSIEKIIMLVYDRKATIHLLQLFDILIKIKQPDLLLKDLRSVGEKDFGVSLITLMQDLFQVSHQMIKITSSVLNSFGEVETYVSFFRQIYVKMREMIISYEQQGLQLYDQCIIANQLLEMLEKVQKLKQLKTHFINDLDERTSIYSCIFKLCIQLLKDSTPQNKEVVLNYLSLNIFCDWLELIQKPQSPYEREKEECIMQFICLCNKHFKFANNSTYFLSLLLQGFEDISTIQQMERYVNEYQAQWLIKKGKQEQSDTNFMIALGNHISSQIDSVIISQKSQFAENEETYLFIAKKYQNNFIEALRNFELSGLKGLYAIEFSKIYGLSYLQLLEKNELNEHQINTDRFLSQQTQASHHLRLFLLKHLYAKHKGNLNEINQSYLLKSKCQWLEFVESFLDEKEAEILIPPSLVEPHSRIKQLQANLQHSNWEDTDCFHELILQGLKDSIRNYQLLTYFMLTFYKKKCSQQKIFKLKTELNERDDIKWNQNIVIIRLLNKYMDHNLGELYQYKINKTEDEFIAQLPLLNYLNMIVAARRGNNPLIEMFFNNANIPPNYSQWIGNRYLIGSLKNPCLGRFEFILKRHAQNYRANSYINCSNNCHYLNPVGGMFYGKDDGCAHPTNQNKCPLCGGVIGAQVYNVLINPQAKTFLPAQMDSEEYLPTILSRKQITLRKIDASFQYELLGYQNGNTIQQLRDNLALSKHYQGVVCDFLEGEKEMIHHKFLQIIVNFVWYALIQMDLISEESATRIFKVRNKGEAKNFLHQATQFYYEQTNRSIKFTGQNDPIIWHLGMTKILFPLLTNYDPKQRLINGLLDGRVRDGVERATEEAIFPYCEREKERFLLDSRTVQKIDKRDVLREIGNLEQALSKYPRLKLYKLLKNQQRPSCENMKRDYKETLAKDFSLLSYLLNNEEISEKLILFKTVYIFVSKLWKRFNKQITRQQAKQPLNKMFDTHFNQGKTPIEIANQLRNFIDSWNRLAELRYALRHGCHNLGELQKMNEQSPLFNFLLDKTHLDNAAGQQMIAFLRVSAEQYNQACLVIQNHFKSIYKQQQKLQIFNSVPLIPTQVTADSKLLTFPTEALKQRVHLYSSFSVEYGISKPQYAFDHIQSLIAKQFIGCRYLVSNHQRFHYITYVGEQSHFIAQIRDDPNQVTLASKEHDQRIKAWQQSLELQGQTRFKNIKMILLSLENIIVFYKNFKNVITDPDMPLRNFIHERNIRGIAKQFMVEPLQSLPISVLADLYERVEMLSFQKIETRLNIVYQAQLEQNEKKEFIQMLKLMKYEAEKTNIPNYHEFRVALYRLAGRSLVLMMADEKQSIAEQLCYVQYFWPKGMDTNKLQQPRFIDKIGRIRLSKVGAMLELIPQDKHQISKEKSKQANKPDMSKQKMEKLGGQKVTAKNQKTRKADRT